MSTVEIQDTVAYELDEDSQEELLDSELNTDIEKLSKELGGYQLNSEKKKAWIVSINESNKNEIVVDFLLPSTDKFTKTYNIPNKRLPEDNLFRKLIEETGNTINTMELAIGESIEIKYNEKKNSWEPKIEFENREIPNYDSFEVKDDDLINIENVLHYAILILISIPFILVFMRYTRIYGVFIIISILAGYYLILNSE